MPEKNFTITRLIKLLILCILATGANFLLNTFSVYFIKIPLFLDTVFNAAVCFTAGLFPGIFTALLTYTALSIRNGGFDPFILCAIAEVLLIWKFRPTEPIQIPNHYSNEKAVAVFVSIFARLMLLFIVCCLMISILGGIIDYVYYTLLENSKLYFSAEDMFKLGLFQSNVPILVLNILSRFPVNIVDRFIVIFGGYFISQLLTLKSRRTEIKP